MWLFIFLDDEPKDRDWQEIVSCFRELENLGMPLSYGVVSNRCRQGDAEMLRQDTKMFSSQSPSEIHDDSDSIAFLESSCGSLFKNGMIRSNHQMAWKFISS